MQFKTADFAAISCIIFGNAKGRFMGNVVLISGDPATRAEVKALLPQGDSLEEFSSLDELPRPADARFSHSVLLADLAGEHISVGRLEPLRRAGVPLVALISSPGEREAAFRAGFDDYLLRPISGFELKTRLERLARTSPALRASPAGLELERQAAVGRLTSYFCHAVSNSMQAIRGSVDLAREEPDLTPAIEEYLAVCRKETVIIGQKINRLRQIYRPKPAPPEPVALDALLRESLSMASDDLLRNNVTPREQIEQPLPAIHSSADRLTLAFLMMIFHLSQELGVRGGGELRVQAGRERGFVQITLGAIPGAQEAAAEPAEDALPAGLEPARELIQAERGQLQAFHRGNGFHLQVRFPAGTGAPAAP
jgi:signal transduction histidine kinase